mmetsp:Transcript_20959/g.59811  ORF Transcript_20959/g.59811 Transcript_20959/m.59811 type:complete len:307 (+) Transcript_20959:169-1089(+)
MVNKAEGNVVATGNEKTVTVTTATNSTPPAKKTTAGAAAQKKGTSATSTPPANKVFVTSINERLNKAIADDKSEKNRSPDLVGLAADFDHMRKQLRGLIAACKKYHETSAQTETSKKEIISFMAKLADGSPLHDDIGKANNSDSLVHIQSSAAKKAKDNVIEFQKKVLDYAIEWESIVTSRADVELKKCKKLETDQEHYEGKVEKLREEVNKLETAGKKPGNAKLEKLARNEEKLKASFKVHEAAANKACVLLEQIVQHGWKDLYHMVKATVNCEKHRVDGEAATFAEMKEALDRMAVIHSATKKA